MSLSSLTDQFRQSSPLVKLGVVALVVFWGVAIAGIIGAAILLLEQPSQAAQPTPGASNGPVITLSPATGSAGSSVSVTGEGWNPGSMVLIYLSPADNAYALASAAVDGNGRFTTSLVVPQDSRWLSPGSATVIARTDDNLVSAQAALTIVAPATLPTETPAVPATPTPTATSSVPPTPTATPQPGAPVATTSTDLNVRGGPGLDYPILGLLRAGQTAEITGLSADANWWQIRFPGVPGERGWLAGRYVTARNTQNIPVVQAPPLPPTPTPVPPTRVPPTATPIVFTDWRAEYYSNAGLNGGPALVRNDVAISFNWGGGSPAAGIPADNFSARWTRSLYLPAGLYRIYVGVDDGVRIWVDGNLVLDQWRDSSPTTYTVDVRLSEGQHNFRVEYYERSGGASIDLRWQRLSDSNQGPQAVIGGPYTVSEGSTLTLDGSRSYDPDGRIEALDWDFNYDGHNFDRDASGKYPEMRYPDGPATLIVALRATDNRGASQIVTTQVTVQNVAPWVEAGGPYAGQAGAVINFAGSAQDAGSNDQNSLVYRWDFGDGASANGRTASHTYVQAGTYTARLTVSDKDGGQSSDTATVQVGAVNKAPVAVISGPTSGKTGESLSFSGGNSSDSDGSIASYAWNFGDGATASGVNASHSYGQAGSYQVTLTVTDNSGLTASSSVIVTISQVVKLPPTAKIDGPATGLVGQPVSFSGAKSSDSDGSIASYAWNFGDGATASGTEVSHTFGAYGTYKVTLTVTDSDGLTGETNLTISVDEIIQVEQPPTAKLVGPSAGSAGLALTFDGSGSSDVDGSIVSYSWGFGDGQASSGPLPTATYTYTQTGTYTVTLTVTDDMGMTDTDALPVTIN